MEVFETSLPHLKKLYGETIDISRLRELFMETETAWHNNLRRFKNHDVERILIVEAPCTTGTKGEISQYFYKRIENSFHQKIWKGVYPDTPVPADMEEAYNMLAAKGFLLLDSIPFSLKFAGKRDKKAYTELLQVSLSQLKDKLDKVTIAPHAVVAFAFKVNAQKLMEVTDGRLELKNGQELLLTENHIAADASGYTNSAMLRSIFGL